MADVEFALHQGPACLLADSRKKWPKTSVQVESVVAFQGRPVVETVLLEGPDATQAVQEIFRRSSADHVEVLEQGQDRARLRLRVQHCPLLPLLVDQRSRPRVPFKVEADSDRWIVKDEPERLVQIIDLLHKNGLTPKMIRRDPGRRP